MQAWESFLETLQIKIGKEAVVKWLSPLKVVHFDACNLYLEAQTSFQIDWFEEHIRPIAKKTFLNNNFHTIKIHLTCSEQLSASPVKKNKKATTFPAQPTFTLSKDSLLPEYTLDNFIFSGENTLVFEIFSSIISQKTPTFNPILLYGEPCTGKTHLLQALTQELQKKQINALYVTTETFTENVVKAIRSGNMQQFRQAHREIDILLVDDIQNLTKKFATQEEFFHTFNALHSAGKQIVLSSNTPPCFLQEIEPRLVSRFEWGLYLTLLKLEKKDLLTLCQNRCKHFDLTLSTAALEFLLESFGHKPQSIQKALEALYMRTTQKNLSTPRVQSLLKDLIQAETQEQLSPEVIVVQIAHLYNVTAKEILGKSQTQECTIPRQMAMYACRSLLNMPYTKIGDFFSRDHSTVISSIKIVEEKIHNKDPDTTSILATFKQKIAVNTKI